MYNSLLAHVLPCELLTYFTVTSVLELCDYNDKSTFLEVSLEENNALPEGYCKSDYQSKGFLSTSRIQDFPLRGKAVYLVIKRRRWRHKLTRKEIKSDYTFIAEGCKLTKELSDFLKGTGRF